MFSELHIYSYNIIMPHYSIHQYLETMDLCLDLDTGLAKVLWKTSSCPCSRPTLYLISMLSKGGARYYRNWHLYHCSCWTQHFSILKTKISHFTFPVNTSLTLIDRYILWCLLSYIIYAKSNALLAGPRTCQK